MCARKISFGGLLFGAIYFLSIPSFALTFSSSSIFPCIDTCSLAYSVLSLSSSLFSLSDSPPALLLPPSEALDLLGGAAVCISKGAIKEMSQQVQQEMSQQGAVSRCVYVSVSVCVCVCACVCADRIDSCYI